MSSFEHHATVDKGLKMKIKRKNVNTEKTDKPKKEQNKTTENKSQSEITQSANGMLIDNKSAKLSLFSDKEKSPKSKSALGKKDKGKGLVKSESSASVVNTSLNGVEGLFPTGNSMEPKLGETAAGKKDCIPDPYEFNAKVEDGISMPIKKMKLEKDKQMDTGSNSASGSSGSTHDVSTDTHDVAILTDPDCLGPCEPGTQVTLEGIVWHESENGVLVVNVTWRGKTYVGTLLDATRHDWAPPRFNCDSPTSEFESRTPKGRGKRRGAANTPVQDTRTLRKGRRGSSAQTFTAPPSPAKSDISVGGVKRKGRPQDIDLNSADQRCTKRSRSGSQAPTPSIETPPADVQGFLECPEPNCNKKYKNANGLKYHQSHAHSSSNSNASAEDAREDMDTEDLPLSVVKSSAKKEKESKKENKRDSNKENGSNSDKVKSDKGDSGAKKLDKDENDSENREELNKVEAKGENSNTPKKKESNGVKTPVNSSSGKSASSQSSVSKSNMNSSNSTSPNVVSSSQVASNSVITSQSATTIPSATLAVTSVIHSASQGDKHDPKLVDIKPKISLDTRMSKPNRPIVPAPTHTVLSNVQVTHSNLSPVMSHTQMSPQLKPIQPKPTIMGEPQNINPVLADLNKDRKKAQKKKPKDVSQTSNNQNKLDQPVIKVERTGVIKTNPMPNSRPGDQTKRDGPSLKDGSRLGTGEIPQRSHGLVPHHKNIDLQHSKGNQNSNLLKVGSPLQVNMPDSQKGTISDDVQSPAYSDISDANESASPAAPSDSSPQKSKEDAARNSESKKEEKMESTSPKTTEGQMMPHYNMYSYYAQSPYRMNDMSPGQKSTGSNSGAPTPSSQGQEAAKANPVGDKKLPESQSQQDKKPEEKEAPGRPKGPLPPGSGHPPSNMSPQQLQEYQMRMYQYQYQYMVNGWYPPMDSNYMRQMMAQAGEPGRNEREQGQGQERVPSRGPDQRAATVTGKKDETSAQKMISPGQGQTGERSDNRRTDDKNASAKDQALREKQNETHQILKENIDLKSEMDKQNYERLKKAEERRRQHMFQEQKMIEERKKMDLVRKGELKPENLTSKAPGTKPIVEHNPRSVVSGQLASVELQTARRDNNNTKRDSRDNASSDPKLKDSREGLARDLSVNKYSDSNRQNDDKSRTSVPEKHRSETPTRNPDTPKQRPGGSSSKSGSPLTSVSSSLPASPASYSPYMNSYPYIQNPHFMAMDPSHPMFRSHNVNPALMSGYPGSAYIHPSQMGYRPGDDEKDKMHSGAQKPPVSSDSDLKKGGESGSHGTYYSNVHKIHELSEKGRPKSRNSSPGPVKTSDSSSSYDKHRDYNNSPPTQRHVHTHHHTHVLQPGPGLQAGAPLQGHPGFSPVYDPYINSAIFVSQAQSPHQYPPK